jgi:carboxyl-terminal processing protease
MSRLSKQFLIMAVGIILGVSLSIGSHVLADRSDTQSVTTLPLEELRTLTEVFGKIKSDYVEEVKDEKLLESAIRGMLTGLDPHSSYLNREDFKELKVGTTGEFGGLGIEVTMEDGFVKVVSPIDDTPAQRAGVQAGDLIIRLDDSPVKGMSLNDAVKLMRGKPGTDITLTIVREGEEKPLTIVITRDIIKVKSVKSRTLEKGYGYLRITNFQTHTTEHMSKAISGLKKDNGGELKGMVLDLRNNPGGVLGAAVSVSDAFLEKGLIVYTEGRAKDAELKFNATPEDLLNGAPIVVLINGGSASASEIVAGALQDHKRAIIMGRRSFGKGSVQTIFPMSNESAVKLTTARYYTPSGRSIQAEGIQPDIIVEQLKVAKAEGDAFEPVKEADLNRHLENGNGNGKKKKQDKTAKEQNGNGDLASEDFVLHQALTMLKGLNILQSSDR